MKKILNFLGTVLQTIGAAFLNQFYYLLGIIWMFASFAYLGEPKFWVILGFGTIFTGIQSIINELKLAK